MTDLLDRPAHPSASAAHPTNEPTDPGPEDLIEAMARLRREGRPFCVATVVRTEAVTSAKAGAKALIAEDGGLLGHIGGGCVRGAAIRAAEKALRTGAPELIRVKPKEAVDAPADADGVPLHKSGCPSGGTVDLFIEPYARAPAIALVGAGPMAETLARLGAASGYRVLSAPSGADLAAADLSPADFVVIATQGRQDLPALRAALESPAEYVAMVASRRKAGVLIERLAAAGLDPARLARLKAPAGLDIGAIEPEEIAVSILAEIVQRRRIRSRADRDGEACSPAQRSEN